MKVLILVVVFLGLLAVLQLMKIYDLSVKLRNKREEEISDSDNRMNANLFLAFGVIYQAIVIYTIFRYGYMFDRPSASEHGVEIDNLLFFNWIVIGIVFFLTQTLLFFFANKYVFDKNRKAYYYPHNNKLELVWTLIPTVVLAVIIIYGLTTWNNITGKASEDALKVELYPKQFDWTARYAGEDGQFGMTNFNLVSGTNPLGIVTKEAVAEKLAEIDETLADLRADLELNDGKYASSKLSVLKDKERNLVLHRNRILQINLDDDRLNWGYDDKLVKAEFHLPKGREVDFQFRSRDVIHSALMYDFRAQMNCVPGMTTKFKYTPIISTAEMREEVGDPEFNYKLTCNKICGAAHWNMTMDIIVEEEAAFNEWLAKKKTFGPSEEETTTEEVVTPEEEIPAESDTTATDVEEEEVVEANEESNE